MLNRFCFAVLGILIPNVLFAQFSYTWNDEKIAVESPVKMESRTAAYGLFLDGDGIKVEISKLEGMEGISGLSGSLDSYAGSFGYDLSEKAKSVKTTDNIYAAWLNTSKDGRSVILMMFATKDFKKHYYCEASFPANKKLVAESIVKSVSSGTVVKTETTTKDVVKTEDEDTGSADEDSGNQAVINDGPEAPDFTLTDVNGNNVSLSSFRGKTVLLDFWGTWCGPCVQFIPKLKALYDEYGGNDFEIVSVANETGSAKWEKMIAEKNMNWTNLIDDNEKVVTLYKIPAYPTLMIVDKNGKIVSDKAHESDIINYLKNNKGSGKKATSKTNTKTNTDNSGGRVSKGITKGSAAPDFTLNDVNGNTVSLSSFKGKTVLLDFWGTWCAPCVEFIPTLKALYDQYGGNDFEIVSVANDPNPAKWKKMVADKNMNWTNVIDSDEKTVNVYKIKAYPTMMIVDKNGVFVSTESHENEIEEYLKNSSRSSSKSSLNKNKGVSTGFAVNEKGGGGGSKQSKDKVTNMHTTGSAVEKTTWRLLADYSPDGYTILDETVTAPTSFGGASVGGDNDFTKWIDGKTEKDVVKSINTVVHEMCHGYTGKLYIKALKEAGVTPDGNYSAFYLGNGEMKLVKHTDVFTTDKINSIFPKKLITGRYETYVYPSEKIMGSQQHGVYGLLDELNAYYAGTKTSLDFYDYYKAKNNSESGWSEFFQDYYGTFYAYLEFKSYMLYYMLYAKQNQTAIYNDIMANEDFLYSFRKTDENWKNLINDFKKTRTVIFNDLKSKGVEVKEEGGFTFFGGSGIGNFSETYNMFLEAMKDKKLNDIAKAMGLESAGGPEF